MPIDHNGDLTEQQALLDRLRDEVEQAKALYDRAKEAYDRAVERMKDLGAVHADGNIRHTIKAYRLTLRNYSIALFRFNRYVLKPTTAGRTTDG